MIAPVPFELEGELPVEPVLAIEASAGTGKTYTLAGLATRYVAELGVPVAELLIVTFTRAAAGELRNRVRRQLVAAASHLRGEPGPELPEPWLVRLGEVATAERVLRLGRLEQAITEFDAMTIATIHSFANLALGTMGTGGGLDAGVRLVDDTAERVTEACSDVLASAAVGARSGDLALPSLGTLVGATTRTLAEPDLVLEPRTVDQCDDPELLLLADLVERSIAVVGERRLRAGTMSFDDVLRHLRSALDGPGGTAVREALRWRYRVVMVDEFQDTDPVQWEIFDTLFGSPDAGTRMVLVGDPKQAIYAFRGANVHTYTRAVATRPGLVRRSLETNWRSDGDLLHALDTVFAGATFGSPEITFVPVHPAEQHVGHRLVDDRERGIAPLSLRLALGDDLERGSRGWIGVDDARRAIFADLGERLSELLSHAHLPAETVGSRRLRPSDVAVLVRNANEGAAVLRALADRRIPAVVVKGRSVLASEAAREWRLLLEAVARPSDSRRARAFALSCFVGMDADELAALGDTELGDLQEQLWRWVGTLVGDGVTEFVRRVWADTEVAARVLGTPDGDRTVTDLSHLAELLQDAAPHDHLSVSGLLAALDRDPDELADPDTEGGVAARRIESDEEAVQIMTVWGSKGLEFPVVCVPTLWDKPSGGPGSPPVIYQDEEDGRRHFDLAPRGEWPTKADAARRSTRSRGEVVGENLRLLYVALTRARHHTLVWWTATTNAATSGLSRVLFCRDADGRLDPELFGGDKVAIPASEAEALDRLVSLRDRAGGTLSIGVHGGSAAPVPWVDPETPGPPSDLAVATLDREIDRSRSRWSFTAMASGLDVDRGDPDDPTLSDRGAEDEGTGGDVDPPDTASGGAAGKGAAPSGLSTLPAGAEFGTLVHSVLELVDVDADDLDAALEAAVDLAIGDQPLDLTPAGSTGADESDGRRRLVDGLRAALESPLGPLAPGRSLRDVSRADRLTELAFELPLGESGRPAGIREVGRLVLDHLHTDDPLRPWADRLALGDPGVGLAGHLTGSIDAVLRIGDHDSRFVVVDYKTNRLTRPGREPGPDDYSRGAMAEAMADHHYPLQALLYSVALHRYLRWSLRGYDPATHLGGAAYLFVRGMTGPEVGVDDGHPHGVFSWAVPAALVTGLSDLLDGRGGAGADR